MLVQKLHCFSELAALDQANELGMFGSIGFLTAVDLQDSRRAACHIGVITLLECLSKGTVCIAERLRLIGHTCFNHFL